MSIFKTKRLATITIVYWFVLLYIIAALVYWFISLQHQNTRMSDLLLNELKHDEPGYSDKVAIILDAKRRKTAQYIGEGSTFLVLILIGAAFVYRATRRQLKLSQQQQNFMMAVTHELKTPIAVTRLNLETMQKRRLEEQQQQRLINITLQEVNRLNSLCNNILLASQLDAGEYKISKNEVNLSELTKRVFNDFDTRNPSRLLAGDFEENLFVNGEEILLEMLMTNLVENAIKYSPRNAPVHLSLSKNSSGINFTVKDEGPGIAEEERSKIFEKFYRLGNEATRTAKGTGLGLYLSKQIARDHNAEIAVSDNGQKGSVFTVTFKT
ncbi:MAG TPA: HAMP domain-containing sensor histidine kinase [Segetibacter sp.]|nr:HAMP domain-containing sensor histidine kinase [Segetibacter sp.]